MQNGVMQKRDDRQQIGNESEAIHSEVREKKDLEVRNEGKVLAEDAELPKKQMMKNRLEKMTVSKMDYRLVVDWKL